MPFHEIDYTHDLTTSDGQVIATIEVTVGIVTGYGCWRIHTLYRKESKTRLGVTTSQLIELPASDPLVKVITEQLNASKDFAREVDEALQDREAA